MSILGHWIHHPNNAPRPTSASPATLAEVAGALGSLALEAGGGAKLLCGGIRLLIRKPVVGFPVGRFFFFFGNQVTVTGIFLVEDFFSKMKIILNKVILKDGDSERW